MNKRLKKILLFVLGVFIFIICFGWFADYWIDKKLPQIINEKNTSKYYITYKNLDISLLTASITASDIIIIPKAALADSTAKAGLYAKIKSVQVSRFSIWSALWSDRLKARKISVIQPEIIFYKSKKTNKETPEDIRSEVVSPFEKVIGVSEIAVKNGSVSMLNGSDGKLLLSAKNISATLDGIVINEDVLKKKIPFSFATYSFNCDSLYFKPKGAHRVEAGKIQTTNTGLSIEKLAYVSDLNRVAFVRQLQTERDLYNIKAEKLSINNLKWGYDEQEKLFVHSNSIRLNAVHANIYRDKTVADDLRKKKLYNSLLRELDMDLRIDTLSVKNSTLEYEEKIADAPGKLRFSPFNLTATKVYSAFGRKKMPDVKIDINARFMDASPLTAHWRLNVLDKTDGFSIKGSILNFPAERITPFSRPYVNLEAKGQLDKIYFDFTGNDNGAKGNFGIDYDDLKLTVYRKKAPEKKNKLLTAVAGLLVKKDSKEKLKQTPIEVEREKDKSFYNMFWKSIQDGLVKILI